MLRFVTNQRCVVLGLGLLLLLGMTTALIARGESFTADFTNPYSPRNPTVVACKLAHKTVCNSGAHATFVAVNPLERPISSAVLLIGEAQALKIARNLPLSFGGQRAPANAPIHARLLSRSSIAKLEPSLGDNYAVDQGRPVWLVTVHAPLPDRHGIQMSAVYTVVIDAATGEVTDDCGGCHTLG